MSALDTRGESESFCVTVNHCESLVQREEMASIFFHVTVSLIKFYILNVVSSGATKKRIPEFLIPF